MANGARGTLLEGETLLGKVFFLSTQAGGRHSSFPLSKCDAGAAVVVLTSEREQGPSTKRAEPRGLLGSRQSLMPQRVMSLSLTSQGFLYLQQEINPWDNGTLECSGQEVRRCDCAMHVGVSKREVA